MKLTIKLLIIGLTLVIQLNDSFSSKKVSLIQEIENFKDMGLFEYKSYYNSNYFLFHTYHQWSRMVVADENYNQIKVIDSIYYKKNNLDIISKIPPTNVIFDSEKKVIYYYSDYLQKYLFLENNNEYIKYEPVPSDTNDIKYSKFTDNNVLFMLKGGNHFYITKDTIEKFSILTPNMELITFQEKKDKSVFIKDTTFYFNGDGQIVKYFKGKFEIFDLQKFTDYSPYGKNLKLSTYKDTLYCPVFIIYKKAVKIIKYFDTLTQVEDLTLDGMPCSNLTYPIPIAYNIDQKGRVWLILYDFDDFSKRRYLWVKEGGDWKEVDINKFGFSDSLYLGDWIYSDSPKVIIPVMNKTTNQMNHLIFDESFNSVEDLDKIEKNPDFYVENVFPNPSNQLFNISISVIPSKINKLKIEMMNSLGQIITQIMPEKIMYDNSTGTAMISVRINQFLKGFYFLTISDGETTRTRSIIIQ